MLQTLKKYFGYSDFRPLQKEIIQAVLDKQDVVVIMPTGGGKSLCYQLPALLLDGLTIVVSPLISLMKDQVDSLVTNGIDAACWNSSLSPDEINVIRRDLQAGLLKLLYVAPERLMMPHFLEYLKQFPINLFAIDEAHCISEWGHDFRPEYRQLQVLKSLFTEIPVIALTATATPRVQEDIVVQLCLKKPQIYKASFNRKNLYYEVRPKTDAYEQILTYIKAHTGDSGIIYCTSRKTVENLARTLQEDGIRALPYHAGLEKAERTQNQDKFIKDDIEIIVATIAFGMGIDKPNVRFVIHYDLPKNLEGYYQETGRAGRDNLKSDCILFYSYGDRRKIEYFFKEIQDPVELRVAYEKLDQIIKYAESYDCRRKDLLNYFGENYHGDNCQNCDNCTQQAEQYDATIAAQKLFSCIARVRERFGMNYIIDILRGSRSERLIHNRHNQLTTYGIGKEYTKKEWQAMIRELIQKDYLYLTTDGYPVLQLRPPCKDVLFNNAKVMLTLARQPIKSTTTEALPINHELFQILKNVRKQIADDENLPPYLIFNDNTLQHMASYFPQTWAGMQKIHGIGEVKLKRFGPRFMREIVGFCQKNQIKEIPVETSSRQQKRARDFSLRTEEITFNLLKENLSVEEIAKRRQLAVSTIYTHLEKLILNGAKIEIRKFVSAEKEQKIRQRLKSHQYLGLKAVKESLGDDFSYGEIRLVLARVRAERNVGGG